MKIKWYDRETIYLMLMIRSIDMEVPRKFNQGTTSIVRMSDNPD
jgi:hypothetical protein